MGNRKGFLRLVRNGSLIVITTLLLGTTVGCPSSEPQTRPGGAYLTPTITQTFDGVKPLDPQPEEFTNSIGMALKLIPAGEFTTGLSDKEDVDYDEFGGLQHKVTISRPFYMGLHEVTQGQYEAVMGENPSRHTMESEFEQTRARLEGVELANLPVEFVTWEQAVAYCQKLSELPEEKEAGRVYTLPTEAQWEYACRAGSDDPFSYGKEITGNLANINGEMPYPDSAEQTVKLERPSVVGSYEPNAFGLFDMHGNVQEWCIDPKREYTADPVTDPTADASLSEFRSLRGGSFRFFGRYARASWRNRYDKASKQIDTGFRVIIQQ